MQEEERKKERRILFTLQQIDVIQLFRLSFHSMNFKCIVSEHPDHIEEN
jgi:hypothetical protein